jgi:uncharacterized phiE125 gp8 family phage protein
MGLRQTTPPAVEPVSLAEAKLHLRVDITDDDALITGLIQGARYAAENMCRRVMVTQSWGLTLDGFPRRLFNGAFVTYAVYEQVVPNLQQLQTGYTIRFRSGKIEIPLCKLQSIDYIKYKDPATGAVTTLDPSQYIVDLNGDNQPGIVAPAYGTYWPDAMSVINAVTIGFTAGYGAAAVVPEGIKSWMKIWIATLYENREAVAILARGKVEPLAYVDRLLDPYTVAWLA